MTKSTKHKQYRKKELSKVKLKVCKKLKKSQNETKTTFKARKIIMKEQLPNRLQTSLVTKKQLNMNELLSRLSHHSVYVQQDGLNGIKELVQKSSKYDLGPYLSKLFTGLNPCILCTDHLIRTTAVKVIEAIILKIGNMIQPFFGLLVSHLSCAMVHLNSGIQSDCLQLMDVLLSHTSSLLALNANSILKNFFLLISRKIDAPNEPKRKSTETYALISNPNSSLATLKWRIRLLRSLSRYLEAIVGEKNKFEAAVPNSPWQVISIGCLPPLVREENGRPSISATKILCEESEAKKFITGLLPLLFQSWAEVSKCNSSSRADVVDGTPLDPVAIELLRYISDLILHLWSLIEEVTQCSPSECGWFMGSVTKHLDGAIMRGFPYCALERQTNEKQSESKEKVKLEDVQNDCRSLNINLAALAFYYFPSNKKLKLKIATYYINLFSSEGRIQDYKLDRLATTASSLLKQSSGLPAPTCEKLLEATLCCYGRLPRKSRKSLLRLPLQACDFTCKYLWRTSVLRNWMTFIVENALENPSDEPVLELLLQFKLRNIPGFAQILRHKKELLREKISTEARINSSSQESRITVVI